MADVEISKHFAEKYDDVYNSVTSDKHSLDDIFNVNLQEISVEFAYCMSMYGSQYTIYTIFII